MNAQRIAVVGSDDYASMDIVRQAIQRIPRAATLILTGYCGINRPAREIALARSLAFEQVRWDCKPTLVLDTLPTAILIFYGGSTASSTYLEDLALAAHAANIPLAMFDNAGHRIDFKLA